jgi:hypothetical protein
MLHVIMLSVVAYKKFAIGKHSVLFSSIVSDEEKSTIMTLTPGPYSQHFIFFVTYKFTQ